MLSTIPRICFVSLVATAGTAHATLPPALLPTQAFTDEEYPCYVGRWDGVSIQFASTASSEAALFQNLDRYLKDAKVHCRVGGWGEARILQLCAPLCKPVVLDACIASDIRTHNYHT
jgi:hypothetical protein